MGKSGQAPQAPDYSGLITAANNQQSNYNNLMNQQTQFANTAYTNNLPTTNAVAGTDLGANVGQNAFGQGQEALYNQVYGPTLQSFVGQAANYDSPDQVALARGQAEGAVANQYEAARGAATRQLQSYGVDPSAARFAALDTGVRTSQAAAEAAAGTQSDINRQTTGLGLEATGLNIASALPGQAAGAISSGTGAGSGAVGALAGGYSPYANALGNPVPYAGLSSGALNQSGAFTNAAFGNELGQFNADQNVSSGVGTALGFGLGALGAGGPFGKNGAFGSSGALSGVGTALSKVLPFAKGGVVPTPVTGFPSDAARASIPTPSRPLTLPRGLHRLSAVPLNMRFDDGGAVPMAGMQVPPGMSPSGGSATDDVPAVVGQQPGGSTSAVPTARINAGEFIMPKDVTNWLGHKHMQGVVAKARKDMSAPQPAHATIGGAAGGAVGHATPHHAMQPGGKGAIPMGGPNTGRVLPTRGLPRSAIAAQLHTSVPVQMHANGGVVRAYPGAYGGAGKPGAINLGGHQPPRPTGMGVLGSSAGAIRSPIPGEGVRA